jgi:quercetin dioxygenase-like cupin family protein
MKTVKIEEALGELQAISEEIRYKSCLEGNGFSVGLISFRPGGDSDPKQINHEDKDVVCHVLKGRGRLRLTDQTIDLEPGTLCHIPKGTLHDFAAGLEEEMILFYSIITTG